MNVGELFFNTGFKVQNADAPAKLEKGMAGIERAMENSAKVMEKVAFILGEIGLKMGALNEESLDMLNATDETTEKFEKSAKATEKKDGKLKKLFKSVGTLNSKFTNLITKNKWVKAGFVASTAAAVAFTKKMGDMALSLEKTAYFTGVDTQKLQILGDQMKQVGGNAETLYGTIEGIRDTITDIELGKGDITAWGWLGISPQGKDPLTVLDELKSKIGTVRNDQLKKFAQGLGVDKDTLYMLKEMGNLEPVAEGTLVSPEELKTLREFSGYATSVFNQWGRVLQRLGAKMVPFVKYVVYGLERVGSMLHSVINALAPFESKIEKVFMGLAIMAGIIAAVMFPTTAAIILLGLALEDLWTYMEGGDSLIGEIIEEFKEADTWARKLAKTIGILASAWSNMPSWLGGDIAAKIAEKKAGQDVGMGRDKNLEALVAKAQAKLDREGYKSKMGGGNTTNINVNGAGDPEAVANKVMQKVNKANTNAGIQRPAAGY